MVSNQELLTRGDKTYARKKALPRVESVTFDRDEREKYLTGFHKRKLQRKEDAKIKAEERDRLFKIEERKKLRSERVKSIQIGMERLKEAEQLINGSAGAAGTEQEHDVQGDDDLENEDEDEDGGEEFKGFDDNSGILKKRQKMVFENNGDETEVTVEEIQLDPYVDLSVAERVLEQSTKRADSYASYVESLSNPSPAPKPRKKKFRYLPKTQRKVIAKKQRQR